MRLCSSSPMEGCDTCKSGFEYPTAVTAVRREKPRQALIINNSRRRGDYQSPAKFSAQIGLPRAKPKIASNRPRTGRLFSGVRQSAVARDEFLHRIVSGLRGAVDIEKPPFCFKRTPGMSAGKARLHILAAIDDHSRKAVELS